MFAPRPDAIPNNKKKEPDPKLYGMDRALREGTLKEIKPKLLTMVTAG